MTAPKPKTVRKKTWSKAFLKPSQVLTDMRHVYNTTDEALDTTQGQKMCRALLKEDGAGFILKLQAFEREHAMRRAAANERSRKAGKDDGDGGPAAKDEGTLKVTGLIDEILETMEKERAQG